jgi:hypothetical protein
MTNQGRTEDLAHWTSVIAKALAYLCLHQGDLRKEDVATQAEFLTGLGLTNAEAAGIIGTTAGTVQVSLSKAKNKGKRKPKGAATRGKS